MSWAPISLPEGNGFLLAALPQNRVRFQPNAGFSGRVEKVFSFRAWDRTGASGITGRAALLSASGGQTAFSSEVSEANVTVLANPWHNPIHDVDVNGDGFLSPLDALLVINYLNTAAAADSGRVPVDASVGPPFYDVDDNGFITARDALLIINSINTGANLSVPNPTAIGEAEEAGDIAAPDSDLLSLLAVDVTDQIKKKRR